MTSEEYRNLHNKPTIQERNSYSANEWREMMKKLKTKKSTKYVDEIRMMLKLARIDFVEEYKFHPTRKWRFDFCDPKRMWAVEYEGLMSDKSGHTTIKGYSDNCEKYNSASVLGWTVLRYTALNYKSVIADLEKVLI